MYILFFHRTRSSKRSTRPAERLECVWERLYRPKAWLFFYCKGGKRRKDCWSSQLYGRNPKESTETYQTMSLFIGMFDLNNLSWSLLIPTETFVHTPYSNLRHANLRPPIDLPCTTIIFLCDPTLDNYFVK